MYMAVFPACVSVHSLHAWSEEVNRPLALELEMSGTSVWVLGFKPRSPERVASVLLLSRHSSPDH